MSTIKADTLTAKTTNTNISVAGSGTGKVALGDGTLLFPDADGSANQPIITNGSAALSFATLPIAGGGTGSTSTTYCNLTSNVTGTMPVGNGGTGATTATGGFDALSPMTAEGDVLYGGTSGTVTKLAKGSNDEVLTLAAGVPSWAAAGGGGAWTLIGTQVASDSASLTQTGLDSTYDTYAIGISDMVPATDDVESYLRVGDSGGIDSGVSDYQYKTERAHTANATYGAVNSDAAAFILMGGAVGSAAGEGIGAMLYLTRPGDGTIFPIFTGTYIFMNKSVYAIGGAVVACRLSAITLDRVQVLFSSGNIASGRLTVWGISHA